MKVAEYRDLIDAVGQWMRSLRSAVTGNEQRQEAMRLRDAVASLKAARCKNATPRDRERASRVIANAEGDLAAKECEFKAADAALCRMAFGAEWR